MTAVWREMERTQAELPAVALLQSLGYVLVPSDQLAAERASGRDVLLRGRLTAALKRLNPWLTDDQAARAIFKLNQVDAVGMARHQLVHEYLTYGMPLDVDGPAGRRTRTVRFFDFGHPDPRDGANEYVVVRQLRIQRASRTNRSSLVPDLVLYVNGLPLVVIEAKAPTLLPELWRERAIEQLRAYQEAEPRWHGQGIPELFDTVLLCVGLCGVDAVYGAVGAPADRFASWRTVVPLDEAAVAARLGRPLNGQDRLIVGLLRPAVLLDILRDFVVFEPERGRLVKKLPRYQQYRAVATTMARIVEGAAPEERGGVIWHTQGSGKSLTMLWLATKLRREPRLRTPTIVVVTDRLQLDDQITRTFLRCGFPLPEHPPTTTALREALTPGEGRTVLTTIQKFGEALLPASDGPEHLNDADNLIVMVDEAHRTQYGLLGARLSKALPRATLVGFTGTPIDRGFRRSTFRRFGRLIDSYTIAQAVEDGATVPIYYEARLPELAIQGPETLDRLFEAMFGDLSPETQARVRRRYATKEALAGAQARIDAIALDIAKHYHDHIRPNGFKAQVVAPSREAAVQYAEALNSFSQYDIEAYPIITTLPGDDDATYGRAREIDQKQIISRFLDPADTVNVLVVVDMLLTGFDAPIEQVLYLDRGLREHTLLQAIARVNRPCVVERDGAQFEKQHGLIVDYWGVSRDLEAALGAFEATDLQNVWHALSDDPAASIEAAARRAESYFADARPPDDVWACVLVFAADADTNDHFKRDLLEQFDHDYRLFAGLLDRFLPDPVALGYADRLTRLTKIRAAARSHFLREEMSEDWSGISAKVKRLIDQRIDASVSDLMRPASILDRDFSETIQGLPHDEARASVMEHALRATITERLAENPAFYERLSERLRAIIEEMRARLIDAAEAVRRLRALRAEFLGVSEEAASHQLGELAFAVYQLLERAVADVSAHRDKLNSDRSPGHENRRRNALADAARAIEQILAAGQAIVDWQAKEDVLRMMRRDVKRELRRLDGLDESQVNVLATDMVEIARHRRAA